MAFFRGPHERVAPSLAAVGRVLARTRVNHKLRHLDIAFFRRPHKGRPLAPIGQHLIGARVDEKLGDLDMAFPGTHDERGHAFVVDLVQIGAKGDIFPSPRHIVGLGSQNEPRVLGLVHDFIGSFLLLFRGGLFLGDGRKSLQPLIGSRNGLHFIHQGGACCEVLLAFGLGQSSRFQVGGLLSHRQVRLLKMEISGLFVTLICHCALQIGIHARQFIGNVLLQSFGWCGGD
mmetsp:Transcript_45154/g.101958  ORF Transcript_45154/g.101958 Transcript_45154/m.101958 type:complete len:231 (-) Transcript_45154:175-867(-)